MKRRLAAIMFTDIVGYSALAQTNETEALALLRRHNRQLRAIFPRHGGREIKSVGDAFLVEFGSALDATNCALEIQQALHGEGLNVPEGKRLRVRIGIHIGDVVEEHGDVLGDTVNVASRIEPLAEPGGISISQQVFDQIQNKIDLPIVKLPPVGLKNIRAPTAVYRIVQPWDAATGTSTLPGVRESHNLAVLPLTNISPDPNDAYFADGLTEELISALSQVRGLGVIARTSVEQYKQAPRPIAQVGAELGVDSVLEGSVRKAGNRIRINLQLVDVPTQRHIWSSSYDREIDDVFAVQSDVAIRTAGVLRLELAKSMSPGEERPPTSNIDAYDLYLRGLVAANRENRDSVEDAIRCFDRATQLDPQFAEAFAAWANLYVAVSGDSYPVKEVMPRARQLAARALELNPDSSEAHSALANIAMQFDHDWTLAEAEFRKAIALNPNNEPAYSFYGLLLLALERFDEAKEVFRQAIQRDPAAYHTRRLAWAELESGNFDAAIDYQLEEVEREPDNAHARVFLALFYLHAGRRAEALERASFALRDSKPLVRFDYALVNALVGRPKWAREVVRAVEAKTFGMYVSLTDLAMLYAALGEKSIAMDLLEKDTREGDATLWLYYRGVFFDSIRDDPRFVRLLEELHLPTSHPRRGPSSPLGTTEPSGSEVRSHKIPRVQRGTLGSRKPSPRDRGPRKTKTSQPAPRSTKSSRAIPSRP
jgi:adenylate cyclase